MGDVAGSALMCHASSTARKGTGPDLAVLAAGPAAVHGADVGLLAAAAAEGVREGEGPQHVLVRLVPLARVLGRRQGVADTIDVGPLRLGSFGLDLASWPLCLLRPRRGRGWSRARCRAGGGDGRRRRRPGRRPAKGLSHAFSKGHDPSEGLPRMIGPR